MLFMFILDLIEVFPLLIKDQILEVIDLAEKKANEKENKYKNIQKVRRYFFIDNKIIDPNSEGVRYVMKCLE